MRPSQVALLFAVVTVASTATAHSWRSVTADRSALNTLRVGARLQLDGMYELPAPASVKGAVEPRCDGDLCWPRLAISSIKVEKP